MPEQQEIAVISIGYKVSPFVQELIERENVAYSLITNNSCDFQIHHADPLKVLDYHLEFTNLIELKAGKSIESLSIFEKLGQFLEFYNPLRLSTLNYLISKYVTQIKPDHKGYHSVWKEVTQSIFDEESFFPLFDETQILHIKEGEVEIPIRQYILSKEIEEGKVNNKGKKKGKEEEETTGIINIDKVKKMKLCNEAGKVIENAAAVIIAPTDIVSLYVVFQSPTFQDTLKKTSGKIAFISPFYPDNVISAEEINILKKTEFTADLSNIVNLIKDFVDVLIINKKDKKHVTKLREAGITVLVEDLALNQQHSTEFLETVLKSVGLSLEMVHIEPKEIKETIGQKLVDLLSPRLSKKQELDEEIVTDAPDTEPEMEPALSTDEPSPAVEEQESEGMDLDEVFEQQDSIILSAAQTDWIELDNLELEEQIISGFVGRAISSRPKEESENAFSDLLAIQNNPLLIDKLFETLTKTISQCAGAGPEKRIADSISFLSLHKPEYYAEHMEEMLVKIIQMEDEYSFINELQTYSIVIRSLLPIGRDVLDRFICKYIKDGNIYEKERLRRIINSLVANDYHAAEEIARVLLTIYQDEKDEKDPDTELLKEIINLVSLIDPYSVSQAIIDHLLVQYIDEIYESLDSSRFSEAYRKIVSDIINPFQEGDSERLKKALSGRKVPDHINIELIKRKYARNLIKVGSIPLEVFADESGLSIEEAEKMIYDMIVKGKIAARIELVSGRLYIVQEQDEEDTKEKEKKEK